MEIELKCKACGWYATSSHTLDECPVCVSIEISSKAVEDEPVDNIKAITTERGENYGKPIDHFKTTTALHRTWQFRRNKGQGISVDQQDALSHGVYMVMDKLVRAAENPMLKDNWDDIQGYVWCIKNALEMEADENE